MEIGAFELGRVSQRRLDGSPPTCIIIGSRGKGKSWVARMLMHAVRGIRTGLVVSGTEEGNDFYTRFVPPVFVHTELNMGLLKQVVDRQKRIPEKTPDDDVLVVLDDCMYDKKFTRDPVMRGIFMNGRHWKVLLIITMQYCMDLPVNLRTNIDYAFVMRETNPAVVERLYKNFGGSFSTLPAFAEALRLCTDDHGCMVIDNVRSCVCHFKASDPGAFRVFHPKAWKYSKQHERRTGKSGCDSVGRSKDGVVIRCKARPRAAKQA
jgi:hypothetical protein